MLCQLYAATALAAAILLDILDAARRLTISYPVASNVVG
jgi:hypothetical protein